MNCHKAKPWELWQHPLLGTHTHTPFHLIDRTHHCTCICVHTHILTHTPVYGFRDLVLLVEKQLKFLCEAPGIDVGISTYPFYWPVLIPTDKTLAK